MKLAAVALAAAGCVASAAPRFPDDVASALAHHGMRRLDTDDLIVYYPADRADEARRVARTIAGCLLTARGHTHGPTRARPRLVMPELPFNNAFVLPQSQGYEDVAVVPTENTFDFATEFGIPPDPGQIGCHEITHYAHAQQIRGLWSGIDWLFGAVATPQSGLDPWFWEGLAVFYEQQDGAGRLRWPVWNGMFEAAYQGRGLGGGDLSDFNRAPSAGGHYLVGSHFIAWLVARYGEDALWQLIDAQAGSVVYPLDLNTRFRRVFGESLSALIGDFSRSLAATPRPPVPPDERRLRTLGIDARYARAPDGTEAVIDEDVDAPPRLELRGADGRVRVSRDLVDLFVPRTLVAPSPDEVSGMSFTADGKTLYVTMIDLATTYQTTRLLRVDVASGRLEVVASGLGPGASVSGDGARYWVEKVDGDAWGLDEIALATGARRTVIATEPGRYVLQVAVSPSGDRALVSEWDGARFDVVVYWTDASAPWRRERVIAGAPGVPAYDGAWVDGDRVVYLAPASDDVRGHPRGFQVWLQDLASAQAAAITQVPFTAIEPRVAGGTVRFLDRDDWRWTIGEVAIPAAVPVPAPAPAIPAPVIPAPVTTTTTTTPTTPATTTPAPATATPPAITTTTTPAIAITTTPAIATTPATTAPATVAPELVTRSDRTYSIFDGLLVPQLHSIAFASPSSGVVMVGVGLDGGDHLGYQRWAITALVNGNPKPARFGWNAAYTLSAFAPWTLSATAQDLRWHEPIDSDPDHAGPESYADRDELDASAGVGRVLRGTTAISASFLYTRDDFADVMPARARLGGFGVHLAQDNTEATRDGGTRRRLALALDAADYPARLSTLPSTLLDTRAELDVTAPLPATRRHAVTLDVVNRTLTTRGAAPATPLVVGGTGAYAPLWQRNNATTLPPAIDDTGFPSQLRFAEPLRGFEDLELPASAAALASLTWRYPLVIDRGYATFLYLLPAVFLRELDVELFGAGALVRSPDSGAWSRHTDAGGALTVSIAVRDLPLLVQYQVVRRFSDDDAIAQQIGLGVGF